MVQSDQTSESGTRLSYGRRTVLEATGGILAVSGLGGTVSAESSSPLVTFESPPGASSPGSAIAPDDGFASSDWLTDRQLSVVKVTNLADEGPGSFRHALERDVEGDGRVVVFEVGGVIEIQGEFDPGFSNTFVAGQTAPGPGITLVKGSLKIDGTNALVQHVRSRAGTETAPGASGEGEAADSISVADASENVIVDHCTASWGTDENLSCGDIASTVTFSNDLVAHGLAAPGLHPDNEEHSNGTLIGHDTEEMAILGTLYAHNNDRHPRLKGGTRAMVANNVAYNFDTAVRLGDDAKRNADSDYPTQASVAGNVYRPGDNTSHNAPIVALNREEDVLPAKVSLARNTTQGSLSMLPENPDPRLETVEDPPVWQAGFDPIPSDEVFGQVTTTAGARPARRVQYDARAIQETRARKGQVIDSQSEVGGYPDHEPVTRDLDVPAEDFGTWLAGFTRAVER